MATEKNILKTLKQSKIVNVTEATFKLRTVKTNNKDKDIPTNLLSLFIEKNNQKYEIQFEIIQSQMKEIN